MADPATLKTPCPKCGGMVQENYRRFACLKCDFSLPKTPGEPQFEMEEVEALLREGTIGPLHGFISKMGRPFAADPQAHTGAPARVRFRQAPAGDAGSAEAVDFSGQSPLGPCPKCKAPVYEQPMAYVCEKSVGPERSCDFRSGKVILQQSIERAQMEKLLSGGRTDLLRGFVSNKTRRKFSAYLARQPAGNVGFEFEPRAPRKGAAGAASPLAKPAAKPAKPVKAAKAARAVKPASPAKPAKKAAPRTRKAAAG